MAVWSSLALKNIARANLVKSVINNSKNDSRVKAFNYVPVRTSGHHDRVMQIETSRFAWQKTKDIINLYFLVGAIPLGLLITYCNIFIGPAKLALIPEGYEPKPWEYHEHPITRFFAKYLVKSPQEVHERNMHNLYEIKERQMIKQLEKRVKNFMKEREDYQAWYFTPYPAKYDRHSYRTAREQMDDDMERSPTGTLI